MKLKQGKYYCCAYHFDDESHYSVFGPAQKRVKEDEFSFPQCPGAVWSSTGYQLYCFFPSKIIKEATKTEIKTGRWHP